MTKEHLIAMLQAIPGNDEVQIWDPDSGEWESVTGCTHSGADHLIRLYSDEDA